MNKRKNSIVIIAIVVCMVGAFFYRYQKINKNVAKAYEKQEYKIGEEIKLDNLKLVIKSYKFVQHNKGDNVDVTLQLGVKNISEKTIDVSPLIYNSKLATEFEYQDTPNIEAEDLKHIKNLRANDEIDLTISYSVLARVMENLKDNGEFKFYIANDLYKKDIIKKYEEDLKLYSKYICIKNNVNWWKKNSSMNVKVRVNTDSNFIKAAAF